MDTEKNSIVSSDESPNIFVYEVTKEIETVALICNILSFPDSMLASFYIDKDLNKLERELISKSRAFDILLKLLKDKHFTAVVEEKYVERVYRDSYYNYYAKKHFEYDCYCKRVLIFKGSLQSAFLHMPSEELQKTFKGYFVIRPLNAGEIGRSLLDPFYFRSDTHIFYVRKTEYTVSASGKQLTISAFPFSMQDGETTTCAEITILNISDYYSQRYPEYRLILPNDISRIAKSLRFERPLPTHGLQYEIISKVFTETGFSPVLYHEKTKDPRKLKHILHYYIESGIPVAIGLKTDNNEKHSIIGIGHGEFQRECLGKEQYPLAADDSSVFYIANTADIINQYCVIDDNQPPYEMLFCKREENDKKPVLKIGNCLLEYLMVPLYKRMLLEAEDAYDICRSILADSSIGFRQCASRFSRDEELEEESLPYKEYIGSVGTEEYPLCIRLFMASAKNFRKIRHKQYLDSKSELLNVYSETRFSRFIWVCELYTIDTYPDEVIGELILDATASTKEMANSLIMIHYPGYYFVRESDFFIAGTDKTSEFHKVRYWTPFAPYRENLTDK